MASMWAWWESLSSRAVVSFSSPKTRTHSEKARLEVTIGRAALVAVGEDVEEQLAAGAVEGHEAELVADQQVHSLKPLLQAPQLPLIAGFDQIADEIGGLAEPDPVPALCGLDAESDREMRLAGADGSDQDHIVAAVDVVAAGQLAQLRFGDALQGLEVDLFERLVVGEASRSQPALYGAKTRGRDPPLGSQGRWSVVSKAFLREFTDRPPESETTARP